MVFSKLSSPEKDAFFGLLDEYFRSRPELFGSGGGQGGGSSASTNALGLAAARAIVGGASAAAASSSSSNNNNNNNSGNNTIPVNKFSVNNPYRSVLTGIGGGGGGGGRKNDDDGGDNNNNLNNESAQAIGRVAAATLAFSGGGQNQNQNQSSSTSTSSLPTFPHRASAPAAGATVTGSNIPTASSAMGRVLGTPGAEVDKLVSTKTSLLSSFRKKAPPVGSIAPLPSAFPVPKSTFGPPPVRRTSSATATATTTTTPTPSTNTGTRNVPPPPEEVEAVEAESEYAEGEWAEVLYDYESEDPGDLPIEAGSRVFVTAKSSDDWWTGQVEGQGKEGLFPASYVKPL